MHDDYAIIHAVEIIWAGQGKDGAHLMIIDVPAKSFIAMPAFTAPSASAVENCRCAYLQRDVCDD